MSGGFASVSGRALCSAGTGGGPWAGITIPCVTLGIPRGRARDLPRSVPAAFAQAARLAPTRRPNRNQSRTPKASPLSSQAISPQHSQAPGGMVSGPAKRTLPRDMTTVIATTPIHIAGTMWLMVAAPGTASANPIFSTLLSATFGTTLKAYATGTWGFCKRTYGTAHSSCNRHCSPTSPIAGTSFAVATRLACVGERLETVSGTACLLAAVAIERATGYGAMHLCEASRSMAPRLGAQGSHAMARRSQQLVSDGS